MTQLREQPWLKYRILTGKTYRWGKLVDWYWVAYAYEVDNPELTTWFGTFDNWQEAADECYRDWYGRYPDDEYCEGCGDYH